MPTYEYVCSKCDNTFERLQSITAEPLKRCPKCRARVRRVIHGGAGLVFKGSGFYSTDYGGNKGTATKEKACEGAESAACEGCPNKKVD